MVVQMSIILVLAFFSFYPRQCLSTCFFYVRLSHSQYTHGSPDGQRVFNKQRSNGNRHISVCAALFLSISGAGTLILLCLRVPAWESYLVANVAAYGYLVSVLWVTAVFARYMCFLGKIKQAISLRHTSKVYSNLSSRNLLCTAPSTHPPSPTTRYTASGLDFHKTREEPERMGSPEMVLEERGALQETADQPLPTPRCRRGVKGMP